MNIADHDHQFLPTLTLMRHTGMLFAWQQQTLRFQGEPSQLKTQLWRVTGKNLLLGWWSFMSIFMNPMIIIGNFFLYWSYVSDWNRFTVNPQTYIAHRRGSTFNRDKWIQLVFSVAGPILFIFAVASALI